MSTNTIVAMVKSTSWCPARGACKTARTRSGASFVSNVQHAVEAGDGDHAQHHWRRPDVQLHALRFGALVGANTAVSAVEPKNVIPRRSRTAATAVVDEAREVLVELVDVGEVDIAFHDKACSVAVWRVYRAADSAIRPPAGSGQLKRSACNCGQPSRPRRHAAAKDESRLGTERPPHP